MTSTVVSNTRVLYDNLELAKNASSKVVTGTQYYIVILRAVTRPNDADVDEFTDSILTAYGELSPVLTYYHYSTMAMLFSTCDEHLFGGSTTKIISSLTSKAVLQVGIEVHATTIILNSRHEVLAWVMAVIRDAYLLFVSEILGLDCEQIGLMTEAELAESFETAGYDIELFSEEQRYGILKRLATDNGKIYIDTRSEKIDARRLKKVSSFVFGG